MIFGKKPTQETSYNNPEHPSGLVLSPLLAIVIVGLACGSMVGAYFLGFRAGHTNGLELAQATNVSQVVRNPIAKNPTQAEGAQGANSSDVYAKLKAPVVPREEKVEKGPEVSKEVKDFLKPTMTPKNTPANASGGAASNTTEVEPTVVPSKPSALEEKKQADMAAIERALNDAKKVASEEKQQANVRVIGGPDDNLKKEDSVERVENDSLSNDSATADQKVEALEVEEVEDFTEPPEAPVRVTPKPKLTATPIAKATKVVPTPKATAKGVTQAKATPVAKAGEKQNQSAQVLGKGWYAQVAAPRSFAEAQSITSKLRSAGFKARIETAQVRDEKYFRVVVGPEATRISADQTLMRLKKQTVVKTEPFIRMVK